MKRKLLSLAAALLCAVGMWADTSLLNTDDGWQKITSFPATLSDYYFVFVDQNNDLMLSYANGTANQGTDSKTMYYTTSQTPTKTANREMLWEISANSDGYSIKNVTEETYYIQTENNEPWKCHTHDNGGGDASWYKWKIVYGDESSLWTIENGKFANNFIGPWVGGNFSDNSEVAGNKTAAAEIGHFFIYTIRKNDLDVVLPAITYLESRTDKSANITTMRTKLSNREYATNVTTDALFDEYKALEISALYSSSAANYTSVLINPSFETGDKTGWTDETTGDKMDVPSNNGLAGKDGTYYADRWWWASTIDIYQTIQNLPEGYYTITALAKAETGSDIVVYAKAGTNDEVTTSVSAAQDYSVEVYLNGTGNIKLGLKGSHVHATHVAVDNFRLTYLGNPYPALEGAIAVASGKTLGFDKDEFTPYNNVGALEALAAATTINAARTASYSVVNGATSALTDATWTPNATEENAFYDGDFSECAEDNTSPLDYTPAGWTASDNMRMMLKNPETYPGLTDASATSAMMSWTAGINYGETTGYTMPLNAYTIYELKFKAAGWNNESRSGMTVSVLNSSDGLAATDLGTPDRDIKGDEINTAGMTSYTKRFKTGAAGNYVFHIHSGNNFVLTDLELKKAATTTIDTDENYTPEAGLANVEMTRTIKVGYNTVCLPFDVTAAQVTAAFGADSEVFNYYGDSQSEGSINLTFTKNVAGTISANEPVLVKATAASTTQTFNGVEIEVPGVGGATDFGTNVDYVGVYTQTTLVAGDYFLATKDEVQQIFKSIGGDKVKPFRAYFKVVNPEGIGFVKLFIDDEATGIDSLTPDPSPVGEGSIYNLAGQRLNKMQKGINIVNGKKILY